MADGNIYEKLRKAQLELKAPKSQRNSFGNYNYRNVEDIIEAAKPVLDKHGLTLVVSDEIKLIGDRYYVVATAAVTNGGDASGVDVISADGYAREEETKKGMDGAQITGAASSYARKYALNGLLAIDDTKDADSDEHTAQRRTAGSVKAAAPTEEMMTDIQKVQIKSFLMALGYKDTAAQKQYLWDTFGVTPDKISKEAAIEIMKELQ